MCVFKKKSSFLEFLEMHKRAYSGDWSNFQELSMLEQCSNKQVASPSKEVIFPFPNQIYVKASSKIIILIKIAEIDLKIYFQYNSNMAMNFENFNQDGKFKNIIFEKRIQTINCKNFIDYIMNIMKQANIADIVFGNITFAKIENGIIIFIENKMAIKLEVRASP